MGAVTTKTDLITQVSDRVQGREGDPITKGDVEKIVQATLQEIESVLVNGGEVRVTGFGTFKTSVITPTSPQTGEKMSPRRVPRFKPGATLKTAVAG